MTKPIEFSLHVVCPSAVSLFITEYCTKHGLKAETYKTTKLPKDEWEVVITMSKNTDFLFAAAIQKMISDYEENVKKFDALSYYLNNMFYRTSYEEDVVTLQLLKCSPSIQIPYEKGKRFNLKMLIDILKSTTYSKDGFYKMLKEYYPKLSDVDLLNIADTHYNLSANHISMLEKFLLGGKI